MLLESESVLAGELLHFWNCVGFSEEHDECPNLHVCLKTLRFMEVGADRLKNTNLQSAHSSCVGFEGEPCTVFTEDRRGKRVLGLSSPVPTRARMPVSLTVSMVSADLDPVALLVQ